MSEPDKRGEPLDWWIVFAMFLAWVTSVPVSYFVHESAMVPGWAFHWLVTFPSLVSLVGLLAFLVMVPTPKPDSRHIAVAVLLAPFLLVAGIVGNLLTLGLGSLVLTGGLASELKKVSPKGSRT